MKPFFVYMLCCADGSYYLGHTDDLEHRVAQHQAGEIEGYTHSRRPVELVWSQETATRDEALAAERRIKGWSRAKKEALTRGDWHAIQRHAWGSRNPLPPALAAGSGPSIPQALRQAQDGSGPSIPQALRQAQDGSGPSIPQGERSVVGSAPVSPEVSKDAQGATSSASARPEVSKDRQGVMGSADVSPEVSKDPTHPAVEGPEGSKDERALIRALAGDPGPAKRRALAKAITLLESTRPDHRQRADALLNALLTRTGGALRLGISGVPGVGKSTFIEALGLFLIEQGRRVAVLAIDPSSSVSGGSILGDKTRMERLSVHDAAFIRPSPASGTLGGVAEHTREAMLVCEAAGYDVVIVETVGVGQSETAVAGMTDLFVLLQLPNAGDDLQAIKKGVTELADLVVINKADLDAAAATRAQAQITSALRLFSDHGNPARAGEQGQARVLQVSALKAQGIDTFWSAVLALKLQREGGGGFAARRKQQSQAWMWDVVHARLQADFHNHPAVRAALPGALHDVTEARMAPSAAARALLNLFEKN